MNNGSDFDFIIIGSGAGGGTLAYKLAPSGKRILLIERGPFVRREKENWNARAVNVEGRYNTKETWRNADGTELHPHTNYYVGGNTKFYGAALFRLREQDFGEIKHYGGISPAWPISYDDMEPYYSAAEELYHVHGKASEDPTEPHRSKPFPYPAVSHEPRIQQLSDDFARHGLKPFHTPLGVMLNETDRHKSPCIRCNTCDGFPCLVNAKADAQICCVDPSLEYPNITLKAGAQKVAPKWTLDLMGKHSLDFWLTSEDLPDPNNRVTINRDGEIVLQYKVNNEEGHKRLTKTLEALMQDQTKCKIHGHEC